MTIRRKRNLQALASRFAVVVCLAAFGGAPIAGAQIGLYQLFLLDHGYGDPFALFAIRLASDDYNKPTGAKQLSGEGITTLFAPPPPLNSAKAGTNYGALTAIAGTENSVHCYGSRGVAVHPTGRYVYFSGGIGSPGRLCGFSIDPMTGAYIPFPGTPVATGSNPNAMAIDPSGTFLFVLGDIDKVWAYTLDPATGVATAVAGSPFATGGDRVSIAIDRAGRFVYVTGGGSNGTIAVLALNRTTGALTPIAGSPFPVRGAGGLAFNLDGRFLFTGIATYAVNAATGMLTQVAAAADPIYVGGVATDANGRFLYVLDTFKYVVNAFAIAANGVLTPIGSQPVGIPDSLGRGTRGLLVVNDLVYAAHTYSSRLYGFRMNATTGALTPLSSSPFDVAYQPSALAASGALPIAFSLTAGDEILARYGVYGGQPPYTWSVATGTLPQGLSLNATSGALSGKSGGAGTYDFTVQVADSIGATAVGAKSITITGGVPVPTPVTVVEFYNAALDHYFITYVADEIAKLDNGTFKGWARTGLSFNAWASTQSGTSAVCRIYIPPGKGDGHFFGRDTNECDGTMAKNPTFILESSTFLYLYPPTLGNCATGQVPVYRVFSNRADANHRYTTSRTVRDQMVAKGWLAEGDGADTVVMCAPA